MPRAWSDHGARWGNDGQLYLQEWRRGFTVHEFRALFFECQELAALRVEVKNLTSTAERLTIERDQAEQRAWWYRSQLVGESQLGLTFASLNDQRKPPPLDRLGFA